MLASKPDSVEDDSTVDAQPETQFATPYGQQRRWPLVVAGIAVGAVGALIATSLLGSGDDDVVAASETVELTLVDVSSTDLIEEVEWSGELAYGSEFSFAGGGGTVTAATPAGTLITRGDVLLVEDQIPRVVLFGTTPSFRTMAEGDEGPDVLELEQNLVELGYDTAGQLSVDGIYSDYTETLVERWQLDLGIEETGTVPPEAVAVVQGPSIVRIAPVVGSQASGSIVTIAASEDLRITVPVDVADADDWTVNSTVDVVLVDESEVRATVEEVGTVVTTDNNGSTIDVVLRLVDGEAEVPEGPVTVVLRGEVISGATAVPTRALIALVEGGFAVEKSDGAGGTSLVGVEIGTFDDGLVEITAGNIAPGDQVAVPQ